MISKAKENEQSVKPLFIREVPIHPEPIVFLASQQQLSDVGRFCINNSKFCVLGVDATFQVGDFYFTFTTYSNLMLQTKRGNYPVCIVPGILHKQKTECSYKSLPVLMTKYHSNTKGVLVFGADGELNLARAMGDIFHNAKHLRCDIHMRDNVQRKLTKLGITGLPASNIVSDIFGKDVGDVREDGIVDCKYVDEFDVAMSTIWPKLYEQGSRFLEYFKDKKMQDIRESCNAELRSICGLGFPPEAYTQNANESMNRLIKEVSKSQVYGPREKRILPHIKHIQKEVERQNNKQFLAVIGRGELSLADEFAHLRVNEHDFYCMSDAQKDALRKRYFQQAMTSIDESSSHPNTTPLSVKPEQSQIIQITFEILKPMFNKAGTLLGQPGALWKAQEKSNEDSVVVYMAASASKPTTPHHVIPLSQVLKSGVPQAVRSLVCIWHVFTCFGCI